MSAHPGFAGELAPPDGERRALEAPLGWSKRLVLGILIESGFPCIRPRTRRMACEGLLRRGPRKGLQVLVFTS